MLDRLIQKTAKLTVTQDVIILLGVVVGYFMLAAFLGER
jgi:hypothetical protein